MRKVMLCMGLAATLTAAAQTKDGGITPQMLQQIEQQNAPTASDRALRNALASNAIDALAKNMQNA
ncbi:MAG: aminopeptidase, partial [Prevotella sp.]|nr:aminopeptidase [Prevotella sp.]